MPPQDDMAALGPGLVKALRRAHKSLDRVVIAIFVCSFLSAASIITATVTIITRM